MLPVGKSSPKRDGDAGPQFVCRVVIEGFHRDTKKPFTNVLFSTDERELWDQQPHLAELAYRQWAAAFGCEIERITVRVIGGLEQEIGEAEQTYSELLENATRRDRCGGLRDSD